MNRFQNYLEYSLKMADANYDEKAQLLGHFPADFFTPEMLEKFFDSPKKEFLHPYRESLQYALSLLWSGEKIDRANDIVENFCNCAVLDNGETLWFAEEKMLRDRNGNFFNASALLPIEADFGHLLKEPVRQKLISVLKALHPVFVNERNKGSLTYVNPQLGRAAMCCALSERYHLSSFEDDVREFVSYVDFLLTEGVAETLTPTYYGVDVTILCGLLCITGDERLISACKRLLNEAILKQLRFFGKRYPVPFRRGYNGDCRTTNGRSEIAYLLGWTDDFIWDYQDTSPYVYYRAVTLYPDIELEQEKEFPRYLRTKVAPDCFANSFLAENFSLGSFECYPGRENIVWQCVTTGGSGWQDGVVYFTTPESSGPAGILRLEAVDEHGNFRCHPYSGEFSMEKIGRLYPFRSFPPEPHIRCVQKENKLLCLFKTDRVDAVLQRFGFNFHFARTGGEFKQLSADTVLIRTGKVFVCLKALERVNMDGSTLSRFSVIAPEFTVVSDGTDLECRMDNYCGNAQSFVQNHIYGGFYFEVIEAASFEEAAEILEKIEITDSFRDNRCNGAVDKRDQFRTVEVKSGSDCFGIIWDHYTNDSKIF